MKSKKALFILSVGLVLIAPSTRDRSVKAATTGNEELTISIGFHSTPHAASAGGMVVRNVFFTCCTSLISPRD